MNKTKILFAILGAIVLISIIFLAINLNKWKEWGKIKNSSWDMRIWILHDDNSKFQEFIQTFKTLHPEYGNKNIQVESFSDERTYYNALVSAITLGQAPDIFVMNNWEISPLENQIAWIDPNIVSPNDFRTQFETVFWEDLILRDEEDETLEFLKWVPLGYEALGIFYNRKYFLRPSSLSTWTSIQKEIKNIANKYSTIIPIALGNSAWVQHATDIIQTFLVLEWSRSLMETTANQARQTLANYASFGEKNGDNRYNILSAPFIDETDIDFFTSGDVAAMIGYPRDLFAIDRIGYQKSFLFAAPFPSYVGKEKTLAIHYNYFAINKDSQLMDMAQDFLAYAASSEWQQAYVDIFPYYLSPDIWVFIQMQEKKILSKYNIVYKNFVEEGTQLVSYDLGNKILFDISMKPILDMSSWQDEKFSQLKSFITCSSTKSRTLLNLSSPCK